MHYIDKDQNPFYDPSIEIIESLALVKITEERFNNIVAELNKPLPVKVMQVSRAQAKIALHNAGFIPQIEEWIKLSNDYAIQTAWADAQYFSRDSALILGFAHALKLSDEQVDKLFSDANEIQL